MWFFSSLSTQCMRNLKNLSFNFSLGHFYILRDSVYRGCACRPWGKRLGKHGNGLDARMLDQAVWTWICHSLVVTTAGNNVQWLSSSSRRRRLCTLENEIPQQMGSIPNTTQLYICHIHRPAPITFYYSGDPETQTYRKLHQRLQSSDILMIFFWNGTEHSQKDQTMTTLSHLWYGYNGFFFLTCFFPSSFFSQKLAWHHDTWYMTSWYKFEGPPKAVQPLPSGL